MYFSFRVLLAQLLGILSGPCPYQGGNLCLESSQEGVLRLLIQIRETDTSFHLPVPGASEGGPGQRHLQGGALAAFSMLPEVWDLEWLGDTVVKPADDSGS